jgi:hypothetical protein
MWPHCMLGDRKSLRVRGACNWGTSVWCTWSLMYVELDFETSRQPETVLRNKGTGFWSNLERTFFSISIFINSLAYILYKVFPDVLWRAMDSGGTRVIELVVYIYNHHWWDRWAGPATFQSEVGIRISGKSKIKANSLLDSMRTVLLEKLCCVKCEFWKQTLSVSVSHFGYSTSFAYNLLVTNGQASSFILSVTVADMAILVLNLQLAGFQICIWPLGKSIPDSRIVACHPFASPWLTDLKYLQTIQYKISTHPITYVVLTNVVYDKIIDN